MAAATLTAPGRPAQRRRPSTSIDKRKLVAFLGMVFGMFMAILDIQIVSASLSEIQAGLGASADEISWVQTAYLIAEVIMIPLSGYLSRAFSTRWIFAISAGGFTFMSFLCGTATIDRPDDRLSRAAGLHRRRHDPDRLRRRLHHLPALEAADHLADDRPRRDARRRRSARRSAAI